MANLLSQMRKTAVDPLTALAIGGAGVGTGVGGALLGRLAMKGTGGPHETPPEKGKRTRTANRLLSQMRQTHGGEPELTRERDFPPAMAHAQTDKDKANLSYYSHPSIVAHELGHLANEQQAREGGPLRKGLAALTSAAYSPLSWILPATAAGAYGLDADPVGDVALGGTAGTTGLQLLEEGRASRKAQKAMKKLHGKTRREDILPLLGGFGTYALGGLGALGIPLMIRELT